MIEPDPGREEAQEPKIKKAIITGVTGQDGSHLADLLLSKNYEVVGMSRRSSVDNTYRIKHLLDHDRFHLVCGDITDVSSIQNILTSHGDVNEIYNLAAQSHVGHSFKQPAVTWDITGKGVINILQAVVDLNMTHVKFYQASSSEMYGKNYDERPKVMIEDGKVVTGEHGKGLYEYEKYQNESTKLMPQSPYAIAKCAAHHVTRLFREAYGIHGSCGILFNHEGPRRGEEFVTRKITKWCAGYKNWRSKNKWAVKPIPNVNLKPHQKIPEDMIGRVGNGELILYPKLRLGNLDAFRDWGYAGDYVEAMWLMLQTEEADDYVVCTGETHTIRDFLDLSFECIDIKDWSEYVMIDPEFYRPAEVDYLRGDSDKIRNKLGWTPETSFKDLISMMIKHDLEILK